MMDAPMPVTLQMLTEARNAYHALLTGQAVASFRDQNGEQVTYSKTNRGDLLAYIDWLKSELGLTVPASAAPMRVWM